MKVCGLLTVLGFIGTVIRSAAAQDPFAENLENYLKQLSFDSIPFTVSENYQPQLKGSLSNGRKPLFLLDTGWTITTLSPDAATGLKTLGELGVVLKDSMFGRWTNSSTVLMDKLVLGRAQFLNQPAHVEELRMDYLHVAHNGVLGCDFYFRNFCILAVRGTRLYVRGSEPSAEQAKALETSLQRSGYSGVPFRTGRGLRLIVDAEVNEQKVHLIADTGAVWSDLDDSQLKTLHLATVKWSPPNEATLIREDLNTSVVGVGKIGVHQLRATTLNSLRLGDRVWKNLHFGVINEKPWKLADPDNPEDDAQGLLGMDMFINNGVLIDFVNRKLWFAPEKKKL